MTTVRQVVDFDLGKMGTTPGWCEKNVREGYGLPARLPDAKADMEFNRDNGMLHDMDTLPAKGAVPVFVDTPSVNEHIEVSINGVLYSDGKRVTNPEAQKYFGWGESCATFRVVEIIADPVPEPEPEPVEEIKVGDKVVPIADENGDYYDYDGTKLVRYDDVYDVYQINGDRVVLTAPRGEDNEIWCAMSINKIRKA